MPRPPPSAASTTTPRPPSSARYSTQRSRSGSSATPSKYRPAARATTAELSCAGQVPNGRTAIGNGEPTAATPTAGHRFGHAVCGPIARGERGLERRAGRRRQEKRRTPQAFQSRGFDQTTLAVIAGRVKGTANRPARQNPLPPRRPCLVLGRKTQLIKVLRAQIRGARPFVVTS